MHLRRIELTNYRRYQHAVIEFPDGVVGLVGRNGSGKSTIVEAITWALFGHEAARTTKELIKRHGAPPGQECRVVLEFDLDGETYRVTRRMRGSTLLADLVIESGGNLLVAGGPNSTAEGASFLERLIGFDRDSFHASVVARQGELNALSDRTPGARKRLIMGMLGIHAVEEAVKRARSERKTTETELGFVREAMAEAARHEERLGELRQGLQAVSKEVAETESTRKEAGTVLASEEGSLKSLQQARVRVSEAVERRQAAQAARTKASAARQSARERLGALAKDESALEAARSRLAVVRPLAERLPEMESLRERFRSAEEVARQENRWRAQERVLKEQAADLARLEARHQGLEGERDDASSARREAELEAAKLSDEAARVDERLRAVDQRLAELSQRDQEIAKLGQEADCPMCQRPLGDAVAVLQSKHAQEHTAAGAERESLGADKQLVSTGVASARKRIEAAASKERDVVRSLESLTRSMASSAQAASRLKEVRAELETLAASRLKLGDVSWDQVAYEHAVAAREDSARLAQDVARLEERVRRRPELENLLEQAAQDEAAADRTITEARNVVEESGWSAREEARAEASCAAARARLEALGRKGASLEERRLAMAAEQGRLEETVAGLKAKRVRAKELEQRVRLLEFLASTYGEKGFLQAFKNHLIARVRPALARTASELLSAMTDGRYGQVVLDEEYNVLVYDEGVAHPLARFSGGETDVVNLALRLAINELVAQVRGRSRLGFIALDEVFGGQDSERRYHVLSALRGLSRTFRQVIVITHHDEVQERLEHVVHVVGDGRGSKVEVVGLNKV